MITESTVETKPYFMKKVVTEAKMIISFKSNCRQVNIVRFTPFLFSTQDAHNPLGQYPACLPLPSNIIPFFIRLSSPSYLLMVIPTCLFSLSACASILSPAHV